MELSQSRQLLLPRLRHGPVEHPPPQTQTQSTPSATLATSHHRADDAFTAGLVCGVLEGMEVPDAARLANRLAGREAASRGGTPVIDRASLVG
jgi:hypothetical protein